MVVLGIIVITILSAVLLFLVKLFLDDVYTIKPQLRIVKTVDCGYRICYEVQRKSVIGTWSTLDTPFGDAYSLHFSISGPTDLAQFRTEEDAQKWLQWYVKHRCAYGRVEEKQRTLPEDEVVYKYKAE